MTSKTKRGPDFIISTDLLQAAFNLWGRASDVSISNAMKN
jgi:hypothetical protein